MQHAMAGRDPAMSVRRHAGETPACQASSPRRAGSRRRAQQRRRFLGHPRALEEARVLRPPRPTALRAKWKSLSVMWPSSTSSNASGSGSRMSTTSKCPISELQIALILAPSGIALAVNRTERARSRRRGVTTVMSGVVALCCSSEALPVFRRSTRGNHRSDPVRNASRSEFQALSHSPSSLRALLRRMPKGGDLHSHLSGAVRTERLIEWGAEDGLCVTTATSTATPPPCDAGQVPLAAALSDPILYDDVLRAWSMAGFQGTVLEAHAHFFATFGKFGAVLSDARTGDAIADVVSTAGRNRQLYVETHAGLEFEHGRERGLALHRARGPMGRGLLARRAHSDHGRPRLQRDSRNHESVPRQCARQESEPARVRHARSRSGLRRRGAVSALGQPHQRSRVRLRTMGLRVRARPGRVPGCRGQSRLAGRRPEFTPVLRR